MVFHITAEDVLTLYIWDIMSKKLSGTPNMETGKSLNLRE
jgi:hypothetical protein